MANKTIEELKSEAAVIRDATEEGENTATRVGTALIDMIDSLSNATVNGIKGYMVIESTSELPTNPTSDQQMIGYLLDTTLYVYVGTGGDTLDGKYKSADLKGPQGATGPAGADGHDGVSLGEVALVNNLTEGGEESALTAEQGKRLKALIDDELFSNDGVKSFEVAVNHVNKYYCNRQTGAKTSVNNTATNYTEVELNGADYVAFNGITVAVGGSSSYGYCFGYYATPNDSSSWVTVAIGNWDVEGNTQKTKDYLRKVPSSATHFRTTSSCYNVLTADNFYCRLIYGKPLTENLWGLYGYAEWEDIASSDITVTTKKGIKNDGTTPTNNNYDIWSVDVSGMKFVRFSRYATVGSAELGYSFYDSNNTAIMPSRYLNTGVAVTLTDEIIQVPENAKYFKFSVHRTNFEGDWYVRKQVAIEGNVSDRISGLKKKEDEFIAQIEELIGNDFQSGTILLADILRYDTTNYVRGYIDEDEVHINIEIDTQTNIVCTIYKELNGTTTDQVMLVNNAQSVELDWKRDDTFKHLVLRFGSSDSSTITLSQVLAAITSSSITYKTSILQYESKANEIEMPITGLVSADSGTSVMADSIYTPEQYNLGGFRVIIPTYMHITWYRGDNAGEGTNLPARTEDVLDGDIVKYLTKYSYNNVFRLKFEIAGSSRTISVDEVKGHIANGRLKILYTPNDGHLSITQRQSHCESYVRALQGRRVTNFNTATSRKSYGTHDLPMFVHCTDIHNDIVRLSSAIEYGRYIQADAMILTGDYPMRGAPNGMGYLKDLDAKFNPEDINSSQKMPILVGTGNHDPWYVDLATMRADIIDPFIEKFNYREDAENLIDGVAYYYVDLDIPAPRDGGYAAGSGTYNHTQLVRVIMLDLVDEQAGEISRWGISQTQIEWFIDTLNSTPQGAAILVGLHTSPDSMDAPTERAAKYAAEVPKVRELKYASDMFTYKGFLTWDDEYLNGSYDFSGSPIMQIIDAFISRTTASGSYSYKVGGTTYSIPQASVVTKTVNWSADFTNAGGIFVAYLCGHTHADLASYIKNATNTQLCLCMTCTVCEFGPWTNARGSSNADCIRGSSGATQDGFTMYVLDMANKRVGIARIGSNMTVDFEPRTACWLSFADTPVNDG